MFGRVSEAGTRGFAQVERFALSRTAFAATAFGLEVISVILIAITTGIAYHQAVYGAAGDIESYAGVGAMAGLAFGLTFLIQDQYGVESLLEGRRSNSRLFLVWNMAFAALAVVGFLTKSTALFSRAWLLIFYIAGLVTAIALNALLHRSLGTLIEYGVVRRRRLMLVGREEEIAKLEREIADGTSGVYIASRVVLPKTSQSDEDAASQLDSVICNARLLGIEDVVISSSWYRADFIEKAIAAFSVLPVVIHLGAGGLIGRFKDARVARFGRATTLSLTREPLGPFEALAKRVFDIVLAGVALTLLPPLFLLVGLLIKLDSPGPVFFRQRRRGYNLEEFGIWKFRSMTTQEDGDVVDQAIENDVRVTRIGRFLRRSSIDELPQLFNVLRGQMSLVGPRPHAVAHDRFFEKRISLYPRRLNVKPGITGWAQVNGFRGATETDELMRQRVEHDLYYIDNWSLVFDIYIVMMTVLSRKTLRNAY